MRDDRPIRSERRMSDLEAMMWTVEKDPGLSTTFGSLTLLDRSPDRARLSRRLAYVVSTIPRLRQHVVAGLGRFAPPEWRDDPDLDLDYHLRHIALPADASEEELFALVTRLVQQPLDRTRPLWEFTFIHGLPGRRAAMLQKMHHTVTDGEGGIRMSERMVDLTAEAEDPEPVATLGSPPISTNLVGTTVGTIGHGARRAGGIAQRSLEVGAGAVRHPSRLVRAGGELPELTRSVARQVVLDRSCRSPLWRQRSLRRWFTTIQVPFDDVKRSAKALGGSVNDLFVTGAAHAAGAYHHAMGSDVDVLRMAMPVSSRRDGSIGGNAFAPTRVLVPTAPGDIVTRFQEVNRLLSATKSEKAIGLATAVAGTLNLLPTSVLVRLARQQIETVDFTTSNLRAAPFDLYIAGARVEANFPLGPVAGTAFNLTAMSYAGSFDMGLHVDAGAVEDPELLASHLRDAYGELIAAGA